MNCCACSNPAGSWSPPIGTSAITWGGPSIGGRTGCSSNFGCNGPPRLLQHQLFRRNLEQSGVPLEQLQTGDWSRQTLPSWWASIEEGIRRPMAVLTLGPGAVLKGLREVPTLLLMQWAFSCGLMQFGLFRAKRCRP